MFSSLTRIYWIRFFCLFLSTHSFANLSEKSWLFQTPEGFEQTQIEFKRSGNVRGTPYVCLPEIVQKLKLKMLYDPNQFRVLLYNPVRANYALFNTYSSQVKLIFSQVKASVFEKARKQFQMPQQLPQIAMEIELSRRPEFVGAELCVPTEFGDRVLRPLLSGKAPLTPVFLSDPRKLESVRVVIDPGHGGNDYGASFESYLEKDLVLEFAKELQTQLSNAGVNAILTRETDLFVTLSERARIANQSSAELFLSLHMNAHPNDNSLKGFEIYVLSLTTDDSQGRAAVAREQQMIPDDLPDGIERAAADLRASANFEKSLAWSDQIRKAFLKSLNPSSSRSIRMGPFYVLYAAQMPALLLEVGYITHESDRNKITDNSLRQKLAKDLASTIAERINTKTKK